MKVWVWEVKAYQLVVVGMVSAAVVGMVLVVVVVVVVGMVVVGMVVPLMDLVVFVEAVDKVPVVVHKDAVVSAH